MVFDKIYNEWAVFFKFGYSVSYKFIDRGIFEILGNWSIISFFKYSLKMQSGFILHSCNIDGWGLLGVRQVWLLFGFRLPSTYRYFFVLFFSLPGRG
jgi:hypothetical protein